MTHTYPETRSPGGGDADRSARPMERAPRADRIHVCLAAFWPGVRRDDLTDSGIGAQPTRPRFAYAGAFPERLFVLTDGPRLQSSSPGRLARWRDRVALPVRMAHLFASFARADLVATHLTSHMLLAAVAKWFRPRLGLISIQYECGTPAGPFRRLACRLKGYAYRRTDRILCLTPGLTQRLAVCYGLHPARAVSLPFGVDTNYFAPAEDPGRGDFILVPGNHQRDEHAVLELARAGTSWKIVRVADAPWVRHVYLPALAAEASLADALRFERSVAPERLRALYRAARLVWLPLQSSNEPAGLTAALEAAACGRPVLVTQGLICEALSYLGIPHLVAGRGEPARESITRALAQADTLGSPQAIAAAVRRAASVEVAADALRRQCIRVMCERGVRPGHCFPDESEPCPTPTEYAC